jgi:predicted nucleic acid-binding protein
MKVYLDSCCIQRPLDSKTQVRIALEAEAVLGILALVESGEIELVSSDALVYESDRTPNPMRQEYAVAVLSRASTRVPLSDGVEERARSLAATGLKPLDALHLAFAEEAQAAYFCTCDDRLLVRGKAVAKPCTRVVSPIELIGALEA